MAAATADDFQRIANTLLTGGGGHGVAEAAYRAHFGLSPAMTERLWQLLVAGPPRHPASVKPFHLLWALYFMRVYDVEAVCAARFGCDVKTYMKYVRLVIERADAVLPDVCSCISNIQHDF